MKKTRNRRATEFFFAPTGAMAKTGSLETTGSAVNLTANQLGLVSTDIDSSTRVPNAFLQAGDTVSTVRSAKFVLGTSKSADTKGILGAKGLVEQAWRESVEIKKGEVKLLRANATVIGTNSAVFFQKGATDIAADTIYGIDMVIESEVNDKLYRNAEDIIVERVTTPSGATFTGIADKVDYVFHLLTYQLNLSSRYVSFGTNYPTHGRKPFVALAIDVSGGTGTAIGALEVGDTVDVQEKGGVTSSITVTKELLQTLNEAITNTAITAASTVEVVDAGGEGTAAIDGMLVIGMEHERAVAYSGFTSNKVRVRVQPSEGFVNNSTTTVASDRTVDQGKGSLLQLRYDKRAFGTYGEDLVGHNEYQLRWPQLIDANQDYNINVIQVVKQDIADEYPVNIYILTPREDNAADLDFDGVGTAAATVADGLTTQGSDGTLLTDLNAIVQPWIESAATDDYVGASALV